MTKKLQKISWQCLLFKATVLQDGFCHKQNPPNMLKLFGLRHDQTLRYCFFIFALDPYIQYYTSALVLFNPPFTNAHKKGLFVWPSDMVTTVTSAPLYSKLLLRMNLASNQIRRRKKSRNLSSVHKPRRRFPFHENYIQYKDKHTLLVIFKTFYWK